MIKAILISVFLLTDGTMYTSHPYAYDSVEECVAMKEQVYSKSDEYKEKYKDRVIGMTSRCIQVKPWKTEK